MRGVGAELRGERRARGGVEDLINVGGRDAVGLLGDGGGDADGPRDGTRARGDARGDARTTESMGEFRVRGFVAFSGARASSTRRDRGRKFARAGRGNSIAIDGTTRSL